MVIIKEILTQKEIGMSKIIKEIIVITLCVAGLLFIV
jgi:hypothetical protein